LVTGESWQKRPKTDRGTSERKEVVRGGGKSAKHECPIDEGRWIKRRKQKIKTWGGKGLSRGGNGERGGDMKKRQGGGGGSNIM